MVTRDFEEDAVASDGQSEPYLVFEWYVVEGIVRNRGNDPTLSGLPGVLKARECLRVGLHLCAPRYLKTATVFGFHGIYRQLADNLDVARNGWLGENGEALLDAWEKEQGLSGFRTSQIGSGSEWRGKLQGAVREGMEKAAVTRSDGWQGWAFMAKHLSPNAVPPREAGLLKRLLLTERSPSRRQVLDFLVTPEGQRVFQAAKSEKQFHEALRPRVDPDTRRLLDAIAAYETFSRLLQDAFEDSLAAMTEKRGPSSTVELARTEGVRTASQKVPQQFPEVAEWLEPYGVSARFVQTFGDLAETADAEDWGHRLLEHHMRIQRAKPPNGKMPWFDRMDDGAAVVRPRYRRGEGGRQDGSYVNAYRTNSLQTFAADLGMVASG